MPEWLFSLIAFLSALAIAEAVISAIYGAWILVIIFSSIFIILAVLYFWQDEKARQ